MPSLIFNKAVESIGLGAINLDTDTFKVMLVTSTYTPNKDTHQFRSSVTNEVGASGSYVSGGAASATTYTLDTANDRIDVTFAQVQFTSATITARAAVIYKDTASAATDNLIAYVDFGADVSSTNGTFTVTFSSPLRFQN